MKCRVHIYLLNDDFSQEYADERYDGNESELNRKHEWEDELEIKTEVTNVIENEDASVPLEGTLPSGEGFKEKITRMRVLTLMNGEEQVANICCSESLFHSYETETANQEYILKVYLNDREPLSNPVPGMYIAAQEFPKALIF